MNLCDLPGEVQDHIILGLHPSAAIALGQTNLHFHTTASLTRLNCFAVDCFLEEKKIQIRDTAGYLCRSCLTFKPDRAYARNQIIGARIKTGKEAHKRKCLHCLIANGEILPGFVVNMADRSLGTRVYCFGCLLLQDRFCTKCNWCYECAVKRKVKTYRKGWEATNGSSDGMGYVINCCSKHTWSEVEKIEVLSLGNWEDDRDFDSS